MAEPHSAWATYAGHRISYRVAGSGPVIVLLKPHLRPKDYALTGLLAERFRVIQLEPLGFGASDRPADYPPNGLHEQVEAVLDEEQVDRFVLWGHSQGGYMAAAVAQAIDHERVLAMIANGTTLLFPPTAAHVARMDREQRVPIGPRTFWHWYLRFDWRAELAAMPFPKLVYLGTEDPAYRKSLPRAHQPLTEAGVTILEYDGLDHGSCWEGPAVATTVLPDVLDWLSRSTRAIRPSE